MKSLYPHLRSRQPGPIPSTLRADPPPRSPHRPRGTGRAPFYVPTAQPVIVGKHHVELLFGQRVRPQRLAEQPRRQAVVLGLEPLAQVAAPREFVNSSWTPRNRPNISSTRSSMRQAPLDRSARRSRPYMLPGTQIYPASSFPKSSSAPKRKSLPPTAGKARAADSRNAGQVEDNAAQRIPHSRASPAAPRRRRNCFPRLQSTCIWSRSQPSASGAPVRPAREDTSQVRCLAPKTGLPQIQLGATIPLETSNPEKDQTMRAKVCPNGCGRERRFTKKRGPHPPRTKLVWIHHSRRTGPYLDPRMQRAWQFCPMCGAELIESLACRPGSSGESTVPRQENCGSTGNIEQRPYLL